jgi:hypothetical protein
MSSDLSRLTNVSAKSSPDYVITCYPANPGMSMLSQNAYASPAHIIHVMLHCHVLPTNSLKCQYTRPYSYILNTSCPRTAHLLASNSAHTFSIFSRFSFAASLFSRVFSSLCARRHMFTLYFASVQLPVTFQMKPRAWHSSRAATTSAQSIESVSRWLRMSGFGCAHTFLHFLGVEMGMHSELRDNAYGSNVLL